MSHRQGKQIQILLDETRPSLQGAWLTAWESEQYGVPYSIITDNSTGFFLGSGQMQKIFEGSDRTAAIGDVADKIGTDVLALAAFDNGVPFYTIVPTSTIDLTLAHGDLIPKGKHHSSEPLELKVGEHPAALSNAKARNPAFDIIPHRRVTGIVTENGVVYAHIEINLTKAVHGE